MALIRIRSLLKISSVACLFALSTQVQAQNAVLDTLQSQINQLRRDQAKFKLDKFNEFLNAVTAGAANPDAALELLDTATAPPPNPDGSNPSPAPRHHHRPPIQTTDTGPEDPNAKGLMVQAHCGLLRFAALFARTPAAAHLKEDWMAWLASAGQNYPFLGHDDIGGKSMRDSPITAYFRFDFADAEQGDWSVRQLPDLYKKYVLDPLGAANDPRVLAAWDVYGGMLYVDQKDDQTKWSSVTLPSIQFKRGLADYKLNPSADKLAALYKLAQLNPNHPDFNNMIDQISTLLAALKSRYTQAAAATN